jgi:hypothetical protein
LNKLLKKLVSEKSIVGYESEEEAWDHRRMMIELLSQKMDKQSGLISWD